MRGASGNRTSEAADRSIFERALDALPDGVLLVNADRKVVYTNPAFKQLWRMPDRLLSQDDEQNLQFVMDQLVDPAGFRHEVERLHSTTEVSQDEIAFKDGRVISRRSLPFKEHGRLHARIWIFTDVTEAKNATVDHLTQLSNRLAFSREFPPFVTAPPDGLLRAVAILDVDHFKRYNDRHGHASGDKLLTRIGATLKSKAVQAGDLVFRIGGEEFLMCTRSRDTVEAQTFFESVRRSIASMGRRHDDDIHEGATVSIGYGSFLSAPDPSIIFERVDAALYQAKSAGRNRIVEAVI